MELANKDWRNDLARLTYFATKKDVVEFKLRTPLEALLNEKVIRFVAKYLSEVSNDFYGNYDDLREYYHFCIKCPKQNEQNDYSEFLVNNIAYLNL